MHPRKSQGEKADIAHSPPISASIPFPPINTTRLLGDILVAKVAGTANVPSIKYPKGLSADGARMASILYPANSAHNGAVNVRALLPPSCTLCYTCSPAAWWRLAAI